MHFFSIVRKKTVFFSLKSFNKVFEKKDMTNKSFFFRLEETKEELDDFQISSRELEQELETQLKQEEKKNKELSLANDRLQNECDSLRVSIVILIK